LTNVGRIGGTELHAHQSSGEQQQHNQQESRSLKNGHPPDEVLTERMGMGNKVHNQLSSKAIQKRSFNGMRLT
jgi:hypothetical protein